MNNGKWQLAFWLMGIICTVWLAGLTTGVIANDNKREVNEREITAKHEKDVKEIIILINENQKELLQRLVAIETAVNK